MGLRLGHTGKHKAVKGQLSNGTNQLIESDRPSLAAQARAMFALLSLMRFGSFFQPSALDKFDHVPGASELVKVLKILRI